MLILFIRGVIVYCLVFVVIRLSGKRQISDLQPFDLVITLLIADLAAGPISNTSIPLVYGAVPIFALFLVQQLVTFLSLKSERMRSLVCGKPLIVIANGKVQEQVLRDARYTLNDMLEQLREKDVFDISEVAYAILETNGNLSVLKKGVKQQPGFSDMKLPAPSAELSHFLVLDGKVHKRALEHTGNSEQWLNDQISLLGFGDPKELFFLSMNASGDLLAQRLLRYEPQQDKDRAGGNS